jgi:hypothetical protein
MSDAVAARNAEVLAKETQLRASIPDEKRYHDWSVWHLRGGLEDLREIDGRHGIKPGDPRVYSIKAYQDEMAAIETKWKEVQQGPEDAGRLSLLSYQSSRADCDARHFPDLVTGNEPKSFCRADRSERLGDPFATLWRHTKTMADFLPLCATSERIINDSLSVIYSALEQIPYGFTG